MDTKINLCDTCIFDIPTCDAESIDIQFGDGIGDDNICECKIYIEDPSNI